MRPLLVLPSAALFFSVAAASAAPEPPQVEVKFETIALREEVESRLQGLDRTRLEQDGFAAVKDPVLLRATIANAIQRGKATVRESRTVTIPMGSAAFAEASEVPVLRRGEAARLPKNGARLHRTEVTPRDENGKLSAELFFFRGTGSGTGRFKGEAISGRIQVPYSGIIAVSPGEAPEKGFRTLTLVTISPLEAAARAK